MTESLPAPGGTTHPAAIEGCLEACLRCRRLAGIVAEQEAGLAQRVYRAIGPHLRHCLDHFACLLRGLDTGSVDYDARDRDERLERDASQFVQTLDGILGRLRRVEPAALRRRLEVRQEAAPGGCVQTVPSHVERELMFLSSHTIHHIALMTLLAEREGVVVPADFGVAFSTASYMRQAATGSGV
jgi:hypothetical protein